MAAKSLITVNFFRAAFDQEPRKGCWVHDRLMSIAKKAPPKRVKATGTDELMLGEYQRLEQSDHDREIWLGQLRRLRPNDRVAEGNEDGYFDDVKLTSGYVTETGHFMVIPSYKAVLYQGSPQQVGWTQLRRYVESFGEEEHRLEMVPILDKDKVKQLDRINNPKKFVLKVAKPNLWSEVDDPSVRDSTKTANNFSADWMELRIGTQRGISEVLSKNILALPGKFLRAASQNEVMSDSLHRVYLEGYEVNESGSEKVMIDFIRDRVQHQDRLDMTNIRTVKAWTRACYSVLRTAYDKQGKHVRQSFRPSE